MLLAWEYDNEIFMCDRKIFPSEFRHVHKRYYHVAVIK